MKFIKHSLDTIPSCYAVSGIKVRGELQLLYASEVPGGPCYSYSAKDFSDRKTVWDNAGGTMSFAPIPETDAEFLAVQNFFPGFVGETAKLVYVRYDDEKGWITRDLINIPYVHRFDIFRVNNINYVCACTVCSLRCDTDIVSNPGKVYIFELPESMDGRDIKMHTLMEGLVRNHGYWRGTYSGKDAGYIACDNGVYAVLPKDGKDWSVISLIDRPVSDIAAFDLDGDGAEEIAGIEPFHGNRFIINKVIDGKYQTVYHYPKELEFTHVVWMGNLRGKPAVIGGSRRADAELFILYPDKNDPSGYSVEIIEKGFGPSNIAVLNEKDRDLILVANNSVHKADLFEVID